MNKETALLIVHARMLNCSWRRIAELFSDDFRQDTGRRLVHDAERALGLNVGAADSETLYEGCHKIQSSITLAE